MARPIHVHIPSVARPVDWSELLAGKKILEPQNQMRERLRRAGGASAAASAAAAVRLASLPLCPPPLSGILSALAPHMSTASVTVLPGPIAYEYEKMASSMELPALAALLRRCDPRKPSTEDKLTVRGCCWRWRCCWQSQKGQKGRPEGAGRVAPAAGAAAAPAPTTPAPMAPCAPAARAAAGCPQPGGPPPAPGPRIRGGWRARRHRRPHDPVRRLRSRGAREGQAPAAAAARSCRVRSSPACTRHIMPPAAGPAATGRHMLKGWARCWRSSRPAPLCTSWAWSSGSVPPPCWQQPRCGQAAWSR